MKCSKNDRVRVISCPFNHLRDLVTEFTLFVDDIHLSTDTKCHPKEARYFSILELADSFESAHVVMFMKPIFDPEEPSESATISVRTSHIFEKSGESAPIRG